MVKKTLTKKELRQLIREEVHTDNYKLSTFFLAQFGLLMAWIALMNIAALLDFRGFIGGIFLLVIGVFVGAYVSWYGVCELKGGKKK